MDMFSLIAYVVWQIFSQSFSFSLHKSLLVSESLMDSLLLCTTSFNPSCHVVSIPGEFNPLTFMTLIGRYLLLHSFCLFSSCFIDVLLSSSCSIFVFIFISFCYLCSSYSYKNIAMID